MKKLFVPKRLGVHRNAAIALYRALLNKARQVDHNTSAAATLQIVIRRKFKEHQNTWSKRRLEVAFNNGYEAIDILDAAIAGDPYSRSRVDSFLSTVPTRLTAPLPPPSRPPKNEPQPTPPEATQPKRSIFDRPLAQVSGKRRVPHFIVSSTGIAFLRYKKPQPLALSMYIKNQAEKLTKWHTRLQYLHGPGMAIANEEDTWDQILDSKFRDHRGQALVPLDPTESSWQWNMETYGVKAVDAMLAAEASKQRERGFRTLQVWKEEIELDKREKERARAERGASQVALEHD